MEIEVNGQAESAPPQNSTLADVLAGLRTRASARGRILGPVVLDGVPLTAEREAATATMPAGAFSRLQAETASPRELVGRTFSGLGDALAALAGKAREASDGVRLGRPAGREVGAIVEDLSFVIRAYRDGLRLLGACGLPGPADGRATADRVAGVLNEVLGGIEAGDPVRTGDALEHELPPALEALGEEIGGWGSALTDDRREGSPAGYEQEPS